MKFHAGKMAKTDFKIRSIKITMMVCLVNLVLGCNISQESNKVE